MADFFDVVVVGASLAGSSAALSLARAGMSVAIFDKASFPRRKACGEGLSELALAEFKRLGLGEQVRALGSNSFFGYSIWNEGDSHSLAFSPSRERGIGIERVQLDQLLFRTAAAESDVCVFEGTRIVSVEQSADFVSVRSRDREFRARYLVLADGANSVLASRLQIPGVFRSSKWGWSMTLDGEYAQALETVPIVLGKKYEFFCTPVSDNKLTVSVVAGKSILPETLTLEFQKSVLTELKRVAGFVGEIVAPPMAVGPIGAASRQVVNGRILLCGDCAESLDPIGGMGMTHALLSAGALSKALVKIHRAEVKAPEALRDYMSERAALVAPLRGFTRATQLLLRHSFCRGFLSYAAHSRTPGRMRDLLSRVGNSVGFRERLCIEALSVLGLFIF